MAGRVVAGRLVRLACERHLHDLEHGHERGLWWDADQVEDQRLYFLGLRHTKAEWRGRPFVLEPWQLFVQGAMYGWKRADGSRRFRIALLEIARKNGKSILCAGNGTYLAFDDGEPGAEVYAAATKRDQAKIVWGDAREMVIATKSLRERITVMGSAKPGATANLSDHTSNSKFEPLGADADSLDGLNLSGAIIDELHRHKSRDMWDVLVTAMGARRQPLIFAPTTAGDSRYSICWEQHERAVQVLERSIADDAFFAYVATLDVCDRCRANGKIAPTDGCPDCDDWRDERVWGKANPNLGVSVKLDMLREECRRAEEAPASRAAFLRLRMNLWDQRESRAVDMPSWNLCKAPVELEALRGRTCYGGLDLASTDDLAAFVLVFPERITPDPEEVERQLVAEAEDLALVSAGEAEARRAEILERASLRYLVLSRFWMPRDNVAARVAKKRLPYDQWIRDGLITATPGDSIDHGYIRRDIQRLSQIVKIDEIAYDRWGATEIVTWLEGEGLTVIPFGQGYSSMAAPTKELVKVVIPGRRLAHGGNPVLTWQASNLIVKTDAAGNMKPDKEKSPEKIDGMVALIMALDRAMRHIVVPSVYATRGIRSIGE